MILREAMLINRVLFNSEAWHGVTTANLGSLERVDEALLRGVVGGHSKLPLTALYLECGAVPLRFIMMSRRIMYLQTILKRDDTELVKKIYKAQKTSKTKGDFADLVEQDLHKLGIKYKEGDIKAMTKYNLKTKVKESVKRAALNYLTSNKTSKTKKLVYESLEMQQYLKSPTFTDAESSLLLALRTRTVRGIRADFPGMFTSRECPMVGCGEEDTLPHLLNCTVLREHSEEVRSRVSRVEVEHLYSGTLEQQLEVTKVFGVLLTTRTKQKEEGTPAALLAGSHALV